MITKILETLGLRRAPRRNGPDEIRQLAMRALRDEPPIAPIPIKAAPRHEPYRDATCNDIYNLLFCDDGRAPVGAMDDSVATLRAIAEDESQEGRNRMWAYNLLREKGESVPSRILLGTIVEVHLDGGLDVLAAFTDGSVRYINHSEKMGFVEGHVAQLAEHIRILLEVSGFIANQIGPWTGERLPPPPQGEVRTTFLVSDGLYFGQGSYKELRGDEMGRLVLTAAERLHGAFVTMRLGSPSGASTR
ncbi:hypothetical protein [Longimicrobium sp.]|uniref:hypothetical protein n=1 Tax=Longimicrobium sp. TaxID=2029185 RepID=UPI002E2EA737|nr:hypothetical protein [Longimicrobium sp.]HEX6039592.1 hypothetical protein [Longimicrobium sp.]